MRSLGLLYLSVGHAFTEDKEGIAFSEKIFFVQFFGPELDVGHLLAARHLLGRHEDLAAIRTRRILYQKKNWFQLQRYSGMNYQFWFKIKIDCKAMELHV